MMPDNCAGERRNFMLRVRLTPNEENALEKMAQQNSTDISSLVRNVLFKYNPLTAAREEIQKAVNYVKNTAKRAYSGAREKARELYDKMPDYIPEDPAYAVTGIYK